MHTIVCWSQDLDFRLVEHGMVDLSEGLSLLQHFPATNVVAEFLEYQGPCRPVLGFSAETNPDAFLEFVVCTDGSLQARVEAAATDPTVFSLLNQYPHSVTAERVSLELAEALVTLFFRQDLGRVAEQLARHKAD